MSIIKKYRPLILGFICFVLLLITTFAIFPITDTQAWNIQTLKEYVDLRFEQVQIAVDKAEAATEKRFEGVNEFRNTLSDQQRTFVPRSEYEAAHKSLETRVTELSTDIERMKNQKQGGNIVWAYVISGISLAGTIIMISTRFKKP